MDERYVQFIELLEICGNLFGTFVCRECIVLARSSESWTRNLFVAPSVFVLDVFTEVAVVDVDEFVGVLTPTEWESAVGSRGSLLRNHPWRRAAEGVMRVSGSQSKHLLTKSTNRGSSQPLRAWRSSTEPGGPRCLPRRETPPLITVVPSGKVDALQYLG